MASTSRRFNSIVLARLTAAFLVLSTLLFVSGIWLEQAGETGETAEGANEAGEGQAETDGQHDAGESEQEQSETFLGINFENPLSVWGFAGVSLLLAAAVLRFGRPALLLTLLVTSAATLLDVREVLVQLGRANALIASLAVFVALTHGVAAVLALMAWRAVGTGVPLEPRQQR